MRRAVPLTLVLGLAACGLNPLADPPTGGADHLPVAGVGPFAKLELDFDTPADEPYLIEDASGSVSDPSPLFRAGGGFRLWFGRSPDNRPERSEIRYAELAALTELPDRAPRRVLVADQAWEAGYVGKPVVLDRGAGRLVMFYQGGFAAPSIGRADSVDDGASWQKHEGPLVVGGASPAAVALADGFRLYFTDPTQPGIFTATLDGRGRLALEAPPLLEPEAGATFDRDAVLDPFVAAVATLDDGGASATRYALYFAGQAPFMMGDLTAIGFAGSFDGVSFERGVTEPILQKGPPGESGAAVLLAPTRAILFFHELKQGRLRIAVAVDGI